MRRHFPIFFALSTVFAVAVACGNDDSTFPEGPTTDDGGTPSSSHFGPGGGDAGEGTKSDGSLGTCDTGCKQGAFCKYNVCIPNLGSCGKNDDCPGDSYCDTDFICVPYGVPASKINDPTCTRGTGPGTVQPVVQCEWTAPDAGDPTVDYVNVYSAPMVADLNLDLDPNKLQPSVALITFTFINKERIGVLRVFDGRDCHEQMRIGGPDDPEVDKNQPAYGTQIAIGDLDNDVGTPNGHPEIVTLHRMPQAPNGDSPAPLGIVAFSVDTSAVATGGAPKLVRKWTGRICGTGGAPDQPVTFGDNQANYGPGIWDIDDDGKPEVILEHNVFDQNGCLLNPPAVYDQYITHGSISTIADVDLDGKPDLVRGNGIYGWNTTTKNWELKPYWVANPAQKLGHVAVADVGQYSAIPGHPATDKLPEIIVTSAEDPAKFDSNSSGSVRVQTLTGEIVFGPVPLFKFAQTHGGHGGPPTASDFDGDGQVEFASAANEFYTIYDPDCDGVDVDGGVNPASATKRPGGKCTRPAFMSGFANGPVPLSGILWARPSQDFSSSETGSSIFDFNGDGRSEAVYRDECYLRVYDGATGDVLFSAPASSGTGQELPVICDVDGDFATEIVVARAANNPACPATDPLVDAGPTPPAFTSQGGFVILRDPNDMWAASRPIWNQHAYSITNVTDDGRIPKSSDVLRNWEQPGMNNFRQNTQGKLGQLALADLTAQIEDISGLCSGQSGNTTLTTRVCNRGTNPVQDGVDIAFYGSSQDGGVFDAAGATLVCESKTSVLLDVGTCTTVSCSGFVPANVDVYVVTDPQGKVADCHPQNNKGASARVFCSVVH